MSNETNDLKELEAKLLFERAKLETHQHEAHLTRQEISSLEKRIQASMKLLDTTSIIELLKELDWVLDYKPNCIRSNNGYATHCHLQLLRNTFSDGEHGATVPIGSALHLDIYQTTSVIYPNDLRNDFAKDIKALGLTVNTFTMKKLADELLGMVEKLNG